MARELGFWGRAATVGACAAAYAWMPLKVGIVSGTSMEPAVRDGSLYVMDRNYYRRQPVRRGDVVIFRRNGATYIKRVVGAPGDVVPVMHSPDGSDDELVMDWQVPKLRKLARHPTFRTYRRLVGREVPSGACYVVGDNLLHSMDSRNFGYVPLAAIQGRVLNAPPSTGLQHLAGDLDRIVKG